MKIGDTNLRVSVIAIAVFVFFTLLLIVASFFSPEVRTHLIWMIPGLFLLLVIPIALNYMSQKEYAELEPAYERDAKNVRVRMINENMIGSIVRIEGVVERTYFQFLNRPQFLVADRTGEISVKMFTNPQKDVNVGDVVEVLGMVIRRYIATGDPVINCVAIRKIDKKMDLKKKE
jgi:RecJ-like exonuclease